MERTGRGIFARAALAGALTGVVGAAVLGALWLAQPGPVAAEREAFVAWVDGVQPAPEAESPRLSIAMREHRSR